MKPVARALGVVLFSAGLLGAASCGVDLPLTPGPPAGPTEIALVFSGTLPVGESSFFSFLNTRPQVLSVTLASTTLTPGGPAVPTPASLGIGIPSGTECALREPPVTVTPRLTAQLAVPLDPGTYCVRIADAGSFPAPMAFAVRITLGHPSGDAAPGSETFASTLAVQGSASRTFTATQAGLVTLTLQSLGAGASAVGLGLGIPRLDGTGCLISQSTVAAPGGAPQVSAQVAPGAYCVAVFDTGGLTRPVTFSVQIAFP